MPLVRLAFFCLGVDLSSHHGEAHGTGAINNACPQCGWFAKQIKQWPAWNGTFVEPGTFKAAASSSSSSSSSGPPPPVWRLYGRRVVFKGKLSMTKAAATAMARAAGALVTTNVSGSTNIIVAGPGESFESPPGVEVWDEHTFTLNLHSGGGGDGSEDDDDDDGDGDY